MRLGQTFLVIGLTLAYLCVELAFNARLLDVVGGSADSGQIHQIEVYGRTLSGVAAALFVLQALLRWHNRSAGVRPGPVLGTVMLVGSGVLVYAALNLLVDTLVQRSTSEFRRISQNIVLIQQALVRGKVQLDGLDEEPQLLRSPAGKAFLAQFSWMASSVDRLDDKIRDAKLTLIQSSLAERLGHAQGFYKSYAQAVGETRSKWQAYSKSGPPRDTEAEVARQQDKAWADYLADLGRRGWTPSSVPTAAQATVRRAVRRRIAVPDNWNLADEAGFRAAVASTVRRRLDSAAAGRPAAERMPLGLSWPAFFAHPTVQSALRQKLQDRLVQQMGAGPGRTARLPAGLRLQADYGSGREFQDEVFAPVIKSLAQQELGRYDAPASAFADGAELERRGKDAARLALVPPIALFFSMLGAILHCTKLLYLLLTVARERIPRWKAHRVLHPAAISLAACLGFTAVLATMDNAITQSRLFGYLQQQSRDSTDAALPARLWQGFVASSLHVVSVGQDRFYPAFEAIRTRLLGGFTFGYDPKTS